MARILALLSSGRGYLPSYQDAGRLISGAPGIESTSIALAAGLDVADRPLSGMDRSVDMAHGSIA
jgi:hypothetical protein